MSDGPQAGWLESVGGAELAVAREALERHAEVTVVDTLDAAQRLLEERTLRLLVLAQPRRGIWSQEGCERLHRAAPLTRLVGVHGSWCEGSQRTDHPWTGIEHVYWHQMAGRAPWLLCGAAPRTVDSSERFAAPPSITVDPGGRVAVSAPGPAFDALADALAALHWTAAPVGSEDCQAAIWDGDPRRESDLARFEALAAAHGSVPRLALCVAPRLSDWRRLEQQADTIISKPYPLEDLLAWCARAAASRAVP